MAQHLVCLMLIEQEPGSDRSIAIARLIPWRVVRLKLGEPKFKGVFDIQTRRDFRQGMQGSQCLAHLGNT